MTTYNTQCDVCHVLFNSPGDETRHRHSLKHLENYQPVRNHVLDKETYDKRMWRLEPKPNSDGYVSYSPDFDEIQIPESDHELSHYRESVTLTSTINKESFRRKWKH
jgi:hypothetical protein